jgi:hypothetical protein
MCPHVYQNMGTETCNLCGRPTHEINWEKENKIMKKWLKENPDAWKTVGWWSI